MNVIDLTQNRRVCSVISQLQLQINYISIFSHFHVNLLDIRLCVLTTYLFNTLSHVNHSVLVKCMAIRPNNVKYIGLV